jgi:rhodanese-related sulfurtransferase
MKKTFYAIALIILITGCMFQKPDYVTLISATELNQLMQKQDIFLVDVHIPQQRHIKATDLFIPFNAIKEHADELPKDKNTPIYLYCEGGPMGNAAARSLYELGYRNLINLDGGAHAWKKAGLAFE